MTSLRFIRRQIATWGRASGVAMQGRTPFAVSAAVSAAATALLVACGGDTTGSEGEVHTVAATAGEGGSITPESVAVDDGETAEFTVEPDSGYVIQSVEGCSGRLEGATYTTGAITDDCTVEASFVDESAETHRVEAAASEGGAIEPTTLEVPDGETAELTVTPDADWAIDEVTGCGGELSGDTYTTAPVAGDCSVIATFFEPTGETHTVEGTAGEGGSISPNRQTVTDGETVELSVNPDLDWGIDEVTGCGGELSASTYTTAPITEDCTVEATFFSEGPDTLTVTATAGDGGSISPEATEVKEGETAEFEITPGYGAYSIDEVTGCEGQIIDKTYLLGEIYETGPVHEDCTVEASFEAGPVDVQADWTLDTDTPLAGVTLHDSFFDDPALFAATEGGKIIAIDPETGDDIWDFEASAGFFERPTADDDHVYATTLEGRVYAIDRDDRTDAWHYDTGETIFGAPAVDRNYVYVAATSGEVLFLDVDTGSNHWTRELDGQSSLATTPLAARDAVYVSGDDQTEAFDNTTAGTRWSESIGQPGVSPSFGNFGPGVLYVGDGTDIVALDSNDGSQSWSASLGEGPYAGLAVGNPSLYLSAAVFVPTLDGELYALDGLTGEEKWQFTPPETWFLSTSIMDDHAIAYAGYNVPDDPLDPNYDVEEAGMIAVQNGEEVWRFEIDGEAVESRPAVPSGIDRERVFFGAADDDGSGTVYAVELP